MPSVSAEHGGEQQPLNAGRSGNAEDRLQYAVHIKSFHEPALSNAEVFT